MDKDSGHYVSWLTNDVNEIYSQSFASLFSGIENFATAIFSLGALCLLSPYIGLGVILNATQMNVLCGKTKTVTMFILARVRLHLSSKSRHE